MSYLEKKIIYSADEVIGIIYLPSQLNAISLQKPMNITVIAKLH